ncbi:alpha-mannosidase [Pontiella desulfatans]|nr:glycoside hydrolase family 38 C-terminal domain-containing protein [Pontiella desulfatans]
MHLIMNTHWDREYRWSFRETQMRLMEAGDILIDTMEKDPRFKYFHPDSQASFLEDYLELRPENKERAHKLVSEGRILAGPWYTLPAEFLVSGEALTRNLLMGHRIAGDMGGVMKCAYNIFSWGQVSQLPQIYRQFGMDTILFYRGIDQSKLDKLEFWWEAPDGSRAMGHTFGSYHRLNFWVYVYGPYIKGLAQEGSPSSGSFSIDSIRDGGGVLVHMGDEYSKDDINFHTINQPKSNSIDAAMAGMETLLDSVKEVSSTSNLLFLQGFDQENPDPCVPDLIDQINERIDYGKIHISSLPDYVQKVRDELVATGKDKDLVTMKGEMLSVESNGDAFAPLYNGVFSARMPLKLMNDEAQYRLEKWAEPAACWHNLLGGEYPGTVLQMAWKNILQNQQHDGIGGCHVDRIQLAMEERYREANDISEAVTRDALKALTAEIDFSNLGDREIGVTVFNSALMARKEIVEFIVDVPHSWGMRKIPGHHYKVPIMVEVFDVEGNAVRAQVCSVEDDSMYAYLKYGSAFNFDSSRIKVAIDAEVPSMGWNSYKVVPKQASSRPVDLISTEPNVLENEYLKAMVHGDGSVNLLDKQTGEIYCGLNTFEDEGECGGPLAHVKPEEPGLYTTIDQPADVALVRNGPLSSTIRIERTWMLPESLGAERKVHVPHGAEWIDYGATKRSAVKKAVAVTTEITLRKGSRRLEFSTVVENTVKDHRLRVLFPSGRSDAMVCHVDSPYDVVERGIAIPDSTGWYEEAAKTMPTASFVDVSDGQNGLAVMHMGLSEYEVTDNKQRAIALTLLRCFGTAGNPSETHQDQLLAQCLGTYTFKYAVQPHSGDWQEGAVATEALQFNAPLRVAECTPHAGTLPQTESLFSVDNDQFQLSALKKAEYEEGMVLRGYNPTREDMDLSISLPENITSAEQITLEEKSIGMLEISDGAVSLKVGKGEIVNLLLKS